MKVVVNSPKVELPPSDKGAKKAPPASLTSVPGTAQDTATLRTGTLSVQSLTAQALNSPEFRSEKVDALAASVRSGEYKVNASVTIDAIVKNENI